MLTVLERLAHRYGERKGLWGIQIINEPVSEDLWDIVQKRYQPVDSKKAQGSGTFKSKFIR